MKIRSGRTRSLIAGIAVLLIMAGGACMMSGFLGNVGVVPGAGPLFPAGPSLFLIIWIIFGLSAAGAAFYNAFRARGLPLYEIDVEKEEKE